MVSFASRGGYSRRTLCGMGLQCQPYRSEAHRASKGWEAGTHRREAQDTGGMLCGGAEGGLMDLQGYLTTLADYGVEDVPVSRPVRLCSVEGCGKKHHSIGYCSKHWMRVRAHGDPLKVNPRGKVGVITEETKPRLLALLAKDCLPYSEIGKRFGVSRERIRQLAIKHGLGKTGRQRKVACNIANIRPEFERHFARLIAACPVQVLPLYLNGFANDGFHHFAVIISGKRWAVTTGCHRPVGNNIYHQFYPNPPCIVQFPDGFMVIPEDAPRRKHVMFALNPSCPQMGAKSAFHGWRDYWNAWHLLKEGQ